MNIWPSQPSASTRLAASKEVVFIAPPARQNSIRLTLRPSTDDERILNSGRHLERIAVGRRLSTIRILDAVLERHLRTYHRLTPHLHQFRIVMESPNDVTG